MGNNYMIIDFKTAVVQRWRCGLNLFSSRFDKHNAVVMPTLIVIRA